MTNQDLEINTIVSWISSGTRKTGCIIDIIPAGKLPSDFGHRLGDTGLPRKETSYVVMGGATPGKKTLYWPRTNLLMPKNKLTAEELQWCQNNPDKIRKLMKNIKQV